MKVLYIPSNEEMTMKQLTLIAFALFTLASLVTITARAALIEGSNKADVLVGADDDNVDNPVIQPPGTAANQSLDNADVLLGGGGNDIIIGLRGSDTMNGGSGRDILIGGLEAGTGGNRATESHGSADHSLTIRVLLGGRIRPAGSTTRKLTNDRKER